MSALATDLYQLTMMAGYYAAGLDSPGTFELFVRHLPPHRSFLVAAGLEQALDYLENVRFTPREIAYLRGLPELKAAPTDFFDRYLPSFRFSGEVWAVPEGTPVFPPAPLLRVTAPLPEAQLVETALLAILTFQTSIASKAIRLVHAADGRGVIEFGARRAHGIEAGLYAARAAMIGGCIATSNVEAGLEFGIPVAGTMAHSWVMTFPSELDAFRQFAAMYGERAVLLIDTYDSVQAARSIVSSGLKPAAVRLDSGDLVLLSRAVREMFDAGGLRDTRILASGDLDEYQIADVVATGAPIDGFGVGTSLSTSSDAPALGGVYKLVEVQRSEMLVPVMKFSPRKGTLPGAKQVWRIYKDGVAAHDLIGRAAEPAPQGGEALLQRVMNGGRRHAPRVPVAELRERCSRGVSQLPAFLRRLEGAVDYPVRISEELRLLAEASRSILPPADRV